jgi:hypothetical protein
MTQSIKFSKIKAECDKMQFKVNRHIPLPVTGEDKRNRSNKTLTKEVVFMLAGRFSNKQKRVQQGFLSLAPNYFAVQFCFIRVRGKTELRESNLKF